MSSALTPAFHQGENLIDMWSRASSDPNQLAACIKETRALTEELAVTGDSDKILNIAQGILEALKKNPEVTAQITDLLVSDISQRGVKGILDHSNSYYVFTRLIATLQAPTTPSHLVNRFRYLISNQPPADRSQKEVLTCVKRLGEISTRAWQRRGEARKEESSYFHRLSSHILSLAVRGLPPTQWLSLGEERQEMRRAIAAALNSNNNISLKKLRIKNSAELSAFVSLYGKRLTCLNLSGCKFVTDKDLVNLAKSMPLLKSLNLESCPKFDKATFQILGQKCPDLENLVLRLSPCEDSAIQALFQNCRNLKFVDLEEDKQLTDRSVAILVQNCKKLEEVRLRNCVQITDASVKPLAERLESNNAILEKLDLTNCSQISEETIMQLLKACRVKSGLYLYGCNVDDATVGVIGNRFPSITEISLGKTKIQSLYPIVKGCPNLREIDISHNPKMQRGEIFLFLEKYPLLTFLNLDQMTQIVDPAGYLIADKCPALQTINLCGCRLSDKFRERSENIFPNCKVILSPYGQH